MKDDVQQHWDVVHSSKAVDEVSWFQAAPHTSVRLVKLASHGRPGASIVDVGAGTSTLVDLLLEVGADVTVLDISRKALDAAARRVGPRGDQVSWVQADLLEWEPGRSYDVLHDRAVFHFLITAEDVAAYVDLAGAAVAPRGALVLGVFAPDGPTSCSGLPTARYDAAALAARFADAFVLEHEERELHHTPAGGTQAFTWVVLRRRDTSSETHSRAPDPEGAGPCADQRRAASAARRPGPAAASTPTA